jgi:hypothetical protein
MLFLILFPVYWGKEVVYGYRPGIFRGMSPQRTILRTMPGPDTAAENVDLQRQPSRWNEKDDGLCERFHENLDGFGVLQLQFSQVRANIPVYIVLYMMIYSVFLGGFEVLFC